MAARRALLGLRPSRRGAAAGPCGRGIARICLAPKALPFAPRLPPRGCRAAHAVPPHRSAASAGPRGDARGGDDDKEAKAAAEAAEATAEEDSGRHEPATSAGTLYVVATPIGHLDDLGARAARVLRHVAAVACEDTRVHWKLQRHHGLLDQSRAPQLLPLHDRNEWGASAAVLERLRAGEAIALVADAGTPLVSDPGFRLVRAARQLGLPVVAVPGPCAAIAALSVAGLPTQRFCFEGFLPPRGVARRQRLRALQRDERTLVFYEAPHRIEAMLGDVVAALGAERQVAVCRELTKRHEAVVAAPAARALAHFQAHTEEQRGEFVVVVAGYGYRAPVGELLAELPPGMAVSSDGGGGGRGEDDAEGVQLPDDDADGGGGGGGGGGIGGPRPQYVAEGEGALEGLPLTQRAPHKVDSDTVQVSAADVLRALVHGGLPVKQASQIAARITGKHKAPLYRQALAVRAEQREEEQEGGSEADDAEAEGEEAMPRRPVRSRYRERRGE